MQIEKTLDFAVPREALWEYLRDREKFATIGYVENVVVFAGEWPREGTRGEVTVRLREKTYQAPFMVLTYRDGHDLVARITGGRLDGASFFFHVRDAAEPGHARLTGGFKLGGFMGLAALAFQDRIQGAVDRELRAFKERVEREAATASPPPSG